MKTIALSEPVFDVLRGLKLEISAKSFEEVIEMLLEKSRRVPKTMFGIDKGIRFTEKDELEFEGGEHEYPEKLFAK